MLTSGKRVAKGNGGVLAIFCMFKFIICVLSVLKLAEIYLFYGFYKNTEGLKYFVEKVMFYEFWFSDEGLI